MEFRRRKILPVSLSLERARVVFAAPTEACDSRCEPDRSCYFFTCGGRIYVHSRIMFGMIETIPSCTDLIVVLLVQFHHRMTQLVLVTFFL